MNGIESMEDVIKRNFEITTREVYSRALTMIFLHGANCVFDDLHKKRANNQELSFWFPDEQNAPKMKYYYWNSHGVRNLGFSCDVQPDYLTRIKLVNRDEDENTDNKMLVGLYEAIDNILLSALAPWFELSRHTYRQCQSAVHVDAGEETMVIDSYGIKRYFRGSEFEDNFWCKQHAGLWMCDACVRKLSIASVAYRPAEGVKLSQREQTEREKMTPKLRLSILERDGFKCRACGRSPREDAVKLHVDHIMPIAKGGLTVEDNLHTLCSECNLAKSDRVIEQMSLW